MVKLEIWKMMLTILSFIRILYLKQQNIVLRYFCSLKFQENLFSFQYYIRSEMVLHTAEKDFKNLYLAFSFIFAARW